MDLDRPAGDSGHYVIRLPRGRDCDAPVELATATAVRLAHAHLLARARVVGTLPDFVRGLGRLWRRKRAYSSSHERTHGGADGERMRERWEKMTPEERKKFRQGVRGCWDAM